MKLGVTLMGLPMAVMGALYLIDRFANIHTFSNPVWLSVLMIVVGLIMLGVNIWFARKGNGGLI